jgi:hypothetical protein
MRTLLVPAAGKSSRYPEMRPKWVLTHPTGKLMIELVLEAMDYRRFDRTVITVLREHCVQYDVDLVLRQAFGDSIEILVLEEPTASAAETVYRTIRQAEIEDQVLVKDTDCVVEAELPEHPAFVVGLSIGAGSPVDRTQTKSFVIRNEHGIILDIVEKEVVSNTICVGIYAAPAASFTRAYEQIRASPVHTPASELFVSHLVSYLILQNELVFRHVEATRYIDWGTLDDWRRELGRHRSYLVDIDGVVLRNYGRYGAKNWSNTFEPIEQNVALLKRLSDAGHEIIFMTARPEEMLADFRALMEREAVRYKTIISGCNHGRRVIVNDFAPTNPYPSCGALSVPRDALLGPYFDPLEG